MSFKLPYDLIIPLIVIVTSTFFRILIFNNLFLFFQRERRKDKEKQKQRKENDLPGAIASINK